jgi:hypothetical protein
MEKTDNGWRPKMKANLIISNIRSFIDHDLKKELFSNLKVVGAIGSIDTARQTDRIHTGIIHVEFYAVNKRFLKTNGIQGPTQEIKLKWAKYVLENKEKFIRTPNRDRSVPQPHEKDNSVKEQTESDDMIIDQEGNPDLNKEVNSSLDEPKNSDQNQESKPKEAEIEREKDDRPQPNQVDTNIPLDGGSSDPNNDRPRRIVLEDCDDRSILGKKPRDTNTTPEDLSKLKPPSKKIPQEVTPLRSQQ